MLLQYFILLRQIFVIKNLLILLYKIIMSKNFSFKSSKWASFSIKQDSLFNHEFIQDKLLIFKTSQHSSKGVVKFKQSICSQSGKLHTQQEIKLWFPIWNQGGNIFFRFNKNCAKFIYQHGLRSYSGRLINFYGGVQSEKNFKNVVFKLGGQWIGVNTSLDSRLRIGMLQNSKFQLSLGNKINFSNQNWTVDFCNILNLRPVSMFSNSIRIIRYFEDQQLFFKAYNNKLRSFQYVDFSNLDTYFTNFTIDYIRKIDKYTKAGIQIQLTKKGVTNSSVVFQKLLQSWHNYKLKAKLSLNRSVWLTFQAPIKNYGKWMFGCQINSLGNKNITNFGLHIDLNL